MKRRPPSRHRPWRDAGPISLAGHLARLRVAHLRTAPLALYRCFRALDLMSALRLLSVYLGRADPDAPLLLRFRSGHRVRLRTRQEIAVLFAIMFRRDYGSVPRGASVVDIGANIGLYSLFAALSGAARVVAVEPEPDNCATFRETCGVFMSRGQVTLISAAVGARSGTRSLLLRGSDTHRFAEDADEGPELAVACLSLRDLLDREAVRSVHVVKLDVEGAEYEILLGADRDTLARMQRIVLEYHRGEPPGRFPELRAHLEACGFTAARVTELSPALGLAHFERRSAG